MFHPCPGPSTLISLTVRFHNLNRPLSPLGLSTLTCRTVRLLKERSLCDGSSTLRSSRQRHIFKSKSEKNVPRQTVRVGSKIQKYFGWVRLGTKQSIFYIILYFCTKAFCITTFLYQFEPRPEKVRGSGLVPSVIYRYCMILITLDKSL